MLVLSITGLYEVLRWGEHSLHNADWNFTKIDESLSLKIDVCLWTRWQMGRHSSEVRTLDALFFAPATYHKGSENITCNSCSYHKVNNSDFLRQIIKFYRESSYCLQGQIFISPYYLSMPENCGILRETHQICVPSYHYVITMFKDLCADCILQSLARCLTPHSF
jgi:hypothetical protein